MHSIVVQPTLSLCDGRHTPTLVRLADERPQTSAAPPPESNTTVSPVPRNKCFVNSNSHHLYYHRDPNNAES
jgi:hypothetical protein